MSQSNHRSGADYNDDTLYLCAVCQRAHRMLLLSRWCSLECMERAGVDWREAYRSLNNELADMRESK